MEPEMSILSKTETGQTKFLNNNANKLKMDYNIPKTKQTLSSQEILWIHVFQVSRELRLEPNEPN